MDLIKLFESYASAGESRTASCLQADKDVSALEKRRPLVGNQCSQIADSWKARVTETYREMVCTRANSVLTDYGLARKNYIRLGVALLALEECSKLNYDLFVAREEFKPFMIHSCIKPGLKKMHLLRQKYLDSKSPFIRELVNHLNCFTQLPPLESAERDGATKPFAVMGPINWDGACEKAGASLSFLAAVTDRERREAFPTLKKETEDTVQSYRNGVLDQNKILKQKQEKTDRLTREKRVLGPLVFGEVGDAETRAKRKSLASVLDPETSTYRKGFFSNHTIPDLRFVHKDDLAKFERTFCPLNTILEKLSARELEMTGYIDSLDSIFRHLETGGLYWMDFINERKPVSALKLRRDVKDIRVVSGSDVLKKNEEYLTRMLDSVSSATGFRPDRAIFTPLYESIDQMGRFYADMERFRKETLARIDSLIESKKASKSDLQGMIKKDRDAVMDKIIDACVEDPVANGFCSLGRGYDLDQSLTLTRKILLNAGKRFTLPRLVNPFDVWQTSYQFPQVRDWQSRPETCNLEFVYEQEATRADALRCLHSTLLTILLAFPIKKVKINFIDPMTTNDGATLTTRLGTQVCSVLNRESDIRQLVEQWQARAALVGKYCDNVAEYNERNRTFLVPYEINVLLGRMTPAIESQLTPFISNGYKYGVYFFAFSEGAQKRGAPFSRVSRFRGLPSENSFAMTPLDDPALFGMFIGYINSSAEKEETVSTISQDPDREAQSPYGDAINNFSVPVGETNGKEVFIKLSNQHIHSFVIGQTGQGKSVFLHDVIAGSILRFSPEEFQVYLLDFKLAGEELYHYRGVKHVRALLANGSDLQVTYQVLKDLRDQMQERSDLMRDAGARTIEEYNREASTRFPRILLVVDECQELFRDNTHRQAGEASVMIDIRSIIEDIARKGRSQGVHLLFATQTLSGTQLPPVIKNNITDCFVFKCVQEDAEQLVPGSGRKVQQLKVGHLLYNSADGETLFHAYLPDINKMVQAAIRKASSVRIEEPRFVFDGTTRVTLRAEERELIERETTRYLFYTLGRSADVQQSPVKGTLKSDMGENLLFVGYNSAQVARASFSALVSLMASNKAGDFGYTFYCLDLLQSEDEVVYRPLEALEAHGLKILPQSRSGELLSRIASGIRAEKKQRIVLFILGQERFKGVRDEYDLPGEDTPAAPDAPRTFGRPQPRTYRSELRLILEKGPELGVHCLLQVDRLSKLLFEPSVTSRFVYRMFSYVCLLRTEKEAEMRLGVEGIYPHQLSEEDANLGAWLIDDVNGRKTRFTPYSPIDEKTISQLL